MRVSHQNKFIRYFCAIIIFLIGLPLILLDCIGMVLQIPLKLLNNFLEDLE